MNPNAIAIAVVLAVLLGLSQFGRARSIVSKILYDTTDEKHERYVQSLTIGGGAECSGLSMESDATRVRHERLLR